MQLAMEDVVRAFAEAPVSNPDGTSGIQLHIDTGSLYGTGIITQVSGTGGVVGNLGDMSGGGSQIAEVENTIIDWDGATGSPGTSFYDLKQGSFDAQRVLVFRYAIFAHQTNARQSGNDCTSGWAEGIQANDFFVSLGGTDSVGNPCSDIDTNGFSVGTRAKQAGTFMHELGHALGLGHGGGDAINQKPNYLSVMNYVYQYCDVLGMKTNNGFSPVPGGCDYSRIDLPDLNENSLDECVGIGIVLGLGPRDWNGNTINEGMSCPSTSNVNIPADINGDTICILPGPNNIFETRAFGDDILVPAIGPPTSINIGPNGICESTAVSDDVQASLLASYEDWNTLFYAFRSLGNFVNGVSSPVQDEPTPELIERAQALLREQTKLTFDLETNGIFRAMTVQSNGKILIGGHFSEVAGQPRNQLARLNADGSLDSAFNPDKWGWVYALAVEADDGILLGGKSAYELGQPTHYLARLDADGIYDASFTPDVNGNVRGIAVQPDGKIVVVGQFTQVDGLPRRYIARLDRSGRLDTTFTPDINHHAVAVAVETNGKILVGGRFTLVNGEHRRFLARLKPDGSVDTSFNPGSEFRIISALEIEPDGKILLTDAFPQTIGQPHDQVARLNPDGSIDTTYSLGLDHYAFSMAKQSDGTVLLGGNRESVNGKYRGYITRLSPLIGN